jgi:hypothetical protein
MQLTFRLLAGGDGTGGMAWIDDIALTGECTLQCEGGCQDGNPCTTDACVDGECVSSPVPGCCENNQVCTDDDPCTFEECGSVAGCTTALESGCLAGACLGDQISEELPLGWGLGASKEDFSFQVKMVGSLSQPAHLVAEAGPSDDGESVSLHLPLFVAASEHLSVRFALRQSVGYGCELGQVWVVLDNEVELPVECGYHDWRMVAVDLPLQAGQLASVSIRFDAASSGAKVEIDDVRVFGACHAADCFSSQDCVTNDPCSIAGCDAGYQCVQQTSASCCQSDEDCGQSYEPCVAWSCVDGQCHAGMIPGCGDGACWFSTFASGLAQGWEFALPSTVGGAFLGWTVDGGNAYGGSTALHGQYETLDGTLPSATTNARVPKLFVGSGEAELSFWIQGSLSGAGCSEGAVELWLNETLVWLSCDLSAQWRLIRVPLGGWVGTVVSLEFRLRSAVTTGGVGFVYVDDVRVDGTCSSVGCANDAGCDDDNACTEDVCIGFSCVHLTNEKPCDDENACTVADSCVEGSCLGSPIFCNDGEPCTDDLCDTATGCHFIPNASDCDDGDACTAGDTCAAGLCVGAPVVCKDSNDCTRDGCTAGVGCEFQTEAFGTGCVDWDGEGGLCWDGSCVSWQVMMVEAETAAEQGMRLYGMQAREGPTPIHVVGTQGTSAQSDATVYKLDENTLAVNLVTEAVGGGSYLAIDDPLVVGTEGLIGVSQPSEVPPSLTFAPGQDLHAVSGTGSTFFVGGEGSSVLDIRSTLYRCQRLDAGWGACLAMPIARSPAFCGQQIPFHIQRIHAISSQKILVAGGSVVNGDYTARVAVWDGNTFDDCDPLGVYSGELYYDDPSSALDLAVNVQSPGHVESFQAIDGTATDDTWVGGTGGLLYRFDGSSWLSMTPASWPAAADWSTQHNIHGLVTTGAELHVVGDGVGIRKVGCRQGFYLHGLQVGGEWLFDRLLVFDEVLSDCGSSPFDFVGIRDVVVDALTQDLYIVGWAPNDWMNPGHSKGLILRLEKP